MEVWQYGRSPLQCKLRMEEWVIYLQEQPTLLAYRQVHFEHINYLDVYMIDWIMEPAQIYYP